jgi:putative transposase
MDENSLSHTRWSCIYHIVFIPKYRRKEIYGKWRSDVGQILRQLCSYKGVEIVEASACSDHIHVCVKILPKHSVSSFMGYLKGKISLITGGCLLIGAYWFRTSELRNAS